MAIRDYLDPDSNKPRASEQVAKLNQDKKTQQRLKYLFIALRIVGLVVALGLLWVMHGAGFFEGYLGNPDEPSADGGWSMFLFEDGFARWVGVAFVWVLLIAAVGAVAGFLFALTRKGRETTIASLVADAAKDQPDTVDGDKKD